MYNERNINSDNSRILYVAWNYDSYILSGAGDIMKTQMIQKSVKWTQVPNKPKLVYSAKKKLKIREMGCHRAEMKWADRII